jgi:single-strand DNA-binding protein
MFDDLRQVTITGGLTREPEMKRTNSGTAVLSLSVGSNQSRKNQSGEYENTSHYFECKVWAKYAEMMETKLSKGMKVMITGDLEFQQWEQDGQKRSKIIINAKQVKPLSTNQNGSSSNNSYSQGNNQQKQSYQSKPSQENGSGNFEDDIPW